MLRAELVAGFGGAPTADGRAARLSMGKEPRRNIERTLLRMARANQAFGRSEPIEKAKDAFMTFACTGSSAA